MLNPMIGMPQGMEWIVILVIVVLVFGAAKLPDLARSSGQALRIFKTETRNLKDEDDEGDKPEEPKEIQAVEKSSTDDVVGERRGDTTA